MFWIIIAILIFLLFLYIGIKQKKRKEWTENYFKILEDKFGVETKSKIMSYKSWLGQSYDYFIAMYGKPNYIEEIEMKSKTKLVLSYSTINLNTKRTTNNKYTFENNILSKIEVKGPIDKVWEANRQINPFL